MSMYSLTRLTGRRRNEGRVTVVQGFEFQRKTLVVLGASSAVGLVPALILALTVSPFFLLLIPAVITVCSYWLFITRSREGMKLSRYRTITDKRKANLNEFHICFEPIKNMPTRGIVVQQTIEVAGEDREQESARTVVSRSDKKRKKTQPSTAIVG